MNANIYNQHTFKVTKKTVEEQIKQLQEVLKLYKKWLTKSASTNFDYVMPMTFINDIEDISLQIVSMTKRQNDFIKEVLKANSQL